MKFGRPHWGGGGVGQKRKNADRGGQKRWFLCGRPLWILLRLCKAPYGSFTVISVTPM